MYAIISRLNVLYNAYLQKARFFFLFKFMQIICAVAGNCRLLHLVHTDGKILLLYIIHSQIKGEYLLILDYSQKLLSTVDNKKMLSSVGNTHKNAVYCR